MVHVINAERGGTGASRTLTIPARLGNITSVVNSAELVGTGAARSRVLAAAHRLIANGNPRLPMMGCPGSGVEAAARLSVTALLIHLGETGVDDIFSGPVIFFFRQSPRPIRRGLIDKLGERF
jgi:hypothetical protein